MNNKPFPDDRAKAIVTALVKRLYQGMFSGFRAQYGRSDLVQIGVIGALESWPKFDPTKSADSTFITQQARSRIIDTLRAANRHRRRDEAACALRPEVQEHEVRPALEIGDLLHFDEQLPVADWLAKVHAAARAAFTAPQFRQGHRYYSFAQAFSVSLLMKRQKLGIRGARYLFIDRAELRYAVRFKRVPSVGWFQSAQKVCALLLENPEKWKPSRTRRRARPPSASLGSAVAGSTSTGPTDATTLSRSASRPPSLIGPALIHPSPLPPPSSTLSCDAA